MANSQQHVTGEVRLRLEPGSCTVVGPSRRTRALQPRPRHVRHVRHVPPPGCRGLRAALGALGRTWARGKVGRTSDDPLARPLHRRSGRRAARLHGEPLVRPAPRARRHRGSRAHVAMLRAAGLLTDEEAALVIAALDRVGVELADGTFVFGPERRRHPHRDRAPRHQLARSAGAKLHTGRSRNDQVATAFACSSSAGHRRRRAGCTDSRRSCSSARRAPAPTTICRATRTSSARSRCCSRITSWRTSGRSPRDSIVGTTPGAARHVAARCGGPRRLEPAARSRRRGRRARLCPPFRQLARRGLRPRLRRRGPVRARADASAPVASGRGDRALVERGVRFLRLADAYSTGSSMLPQRKNPDIAELAAARRPADRRPHGVSRHIQGASALVPTAISRKTRSRCSTRSTRTGTPLTTMAA